MAVSYTSDIYTQERLFFIKLLFRWSGSVWQLLWVDFLVFVSLYMILAAVYQNILFEYTDMKQTFEVTVKWIGQIRTSVPLSFMLGFFVSTVLTRWWNTCMAIPWLYAPSFYCQAIVDTSKAAKSDIARKVRITVLRYLNLSWILAMADISLHIKERFGFWRPTKKEFKLTWQKRLDLINGDTKVQKYFGSLVTDEERLAFSRSAELSNDNDFSYSPEYWLPLVWATRLLRRAKNINLIADERAYLFLVETINVFRGGLGTVWNYVEFNIPLVYTQVAVAAVYIFLMATLVSTQLTENDFVNPNGALSVGSRNASDIPEAVQILVYIPIIGSLEFIFYLGWFKIGVCLLNSLGKDKADLPLSDILNSNLKASVKLGGAEDTIFPNGLTDNGDPEEEQIAEFLHSFDFDGVHAHDKFGTAEETERHLRRALLKRLQAKTGGGAAGQKKAAVAGAPVDGKGDKTTGSKRLDFLNLASADRPSGGKKSAGKKDHQHQHQHQHHHDKCNGVLASIKMFGNSKGSSSNRGNSKADNGSTSKGPTLDPAAAAAATSPGSSSSPQLSPKPSMQQPPSPQLLSPPQPPSPTRQLSLPEVRLTIEADLEGEDEASGENGTKL